jgi:hypothetical protein
MKLSVVILMLWASIATAATIGHGADLVEGTARVVTIRPDSGETAAGWTITATYFPNSSIARIDTVGTTDSIGVTWKPSFAGIVALKASQGRKSISANVSVKFPGIPAGAILVFLVAGTILLGGAGWSLIRLVEHTPTDPEPDGGKMT